MITELYRPTPYEKRAVNPVRVRAVEAHAGKSVLDVGCGNGAYVFHFRDKYEIYGVDWTRSKNWDADPERFQTADGARLPYPDESFDTVLSFETLEHLDDPGAAVREYFRVCRKNLILTVPNCDITLGMKQSHLLYSHWGDPTHCNFFNLESIRQLVINNGFVVSGAETVNPINPLPFAAEVLKQRGLFWKILFRLVKDRGPSLYRITCLIVAEKRAVSTARGV